MDRKISREELGGPKDRENNIRKDLREIGLKM
jgi:hypothetical protein